MKKAFTMIELIFVIVILGILAAVALPKFLGVAQQAHEGNLKAFVGTLNRTVAPTLWSQSISSGHNGDINYTNLTETNITKYIELPKEMSGLSGNIDLSKCDSTTQYKVVAYANKDVAGADYFIACKDGNANQAPNFILYKKDSGTVALGEYNTTVVGTDTNNTDTYTDGTNTAIGTLLTK